MNEQEQDGHNQYKKAKLNRMLAMGQTRLEFGS
jgi:hypothetical protein